MPHGGDHRIILDVINYWSNPFFMKDGVVQYRETSLSKKYSKCASEFNIWARSVKERNLRPKFASGEFQLIDVQSDITIAHLLVSDQDDEMRRAYERLGKKALETKSSLHASRGDLSKFDLSLLKEFITDIGLNLYLYEEKK